jgi:hypothetical protein
MLQSTIHCSGAMFLCTIGPECFVQLSVNMTSLFSYLPLKENASVVMKQCLCFPQLVCRSSEGNKTQGQNTL